MALNSLFDAVKNAVLNHADQQSHTGFDPSALLGQLGGIFNNHAQSTGQEGNFGNVQSSNQDQYGDPGNQGFGNVQSSNRDQYGDPGQQGFGNVQSSDKDPYGDPGRQ